MAKQISVPAYTRPDIQILIAEEAEVIAVSNAQIPELNWNDTDGDAF